jgi:hypothetical protein
MLNIYAIRAPPPPFFAHHLKPRVRNFGRFALSGRRGEDYFYRGSNPLSAALLGTYRHNKLRKIKYEKFFSVSGFLTDGLTEKSDITGRPQECKCVEQGKV